MIAKTIKFQTRTVANKFMATGEEFQLTVDINDMGIWTVYGWKKYPGLDTLKQSEEIALRAIEIFYNSQPLHMYNPKITHAKTD